MKKKLWLIFGGCILFVILLFVCLSVGIFGFMPSFEDLEDPESFLASEVISSDQQILGTYYIENRTNIEYSDLSPYLVQALIATEDARFYNHSGIDIKSLFRVVGKTILGGDKSSGGGSTLTQQLAKNLFPRKKINKFSLAIRKLKEWVIAIKLERNYTKEEIIAMYLNTVEFGNNSFGIRTATLTYFGKEPKDLNVEESATLVGMLKATTYYNPVSNYDNAMQRRNVVLHQMLKANYFTEKEYNSLCLKPIDLSNFSKQDHQYGLATYFRENLRQWMLNWCEKHKKANGKSYNLYKDGLKIYTTINARMQLHAEEAVEEWVGNQLQNDFYKNLKDSKNAPFVNISDSEVASFMDKSMRYSDRYRNMKKEGASEEEIKDAFMKKTHMKVFSWQGEKDTVMSPWDSLWYHKWFLHCGLMSIEPQTGYVRAYVGGINYKYFQFDNVSQGERQVGSTFKPFVYTLAMQEGEYTPCTMIPNVPVCISQPGLADWCPKNSGHQREGEMVTLRWALANSVNYISAYLIKRFPPEAVISLARKMGITAKLEPVPSICLGTLDISVKEMTAAMATYANKGLYTSPMFITRIEDKHGVILEDFFTSQQEAIDEQTAYLMISLMKGVVDGGSAGRLRWKYGLTQPIAGKTGTTQNQSDAWFMGITPALTTGVWVGGELRSIHFKSMALGQGANAALPVWAIYMKKVFNDPAIALPQDDFERPARMTIDVNCQQSNEASTETTNPAATGEDM